MRLKNNRWIVLVAGVLIQIILGGIYAWSTFTPYLAGEFSISKGESGFIFGATIIVFTLVMIFSGRLLASHGPKITAGIGAILFGAGYALASFSGGSFILILVSIGVLSGAGIGFGYVCPLSTGMKWFPNNKGLVTGVAVAGFGGGAILLSSIANVFLNNGGDILVFFRYYGIVAGLVLLIASLLLAVPEDQKKVSKETVSKPILVPPFFLSAAGLFAGTFAGLMIIGNLSPIVQEAGFSAAQAVLSISLFSVGNALGRLSWGLLYDKLKFLSLPLSLFFFAIFSLFLLIPLHVMLVYTIAVLLGFGFGANFVVYAGAISDYFGVASFSKVYPLCFLAYGAAGLLGPGAGGMIADSTGSFNSALLIAVVLLVAAGIILQKNLSRFQNVQAQKSS